jgi:hypothetical protein
LEFKGLKVFPSEPGAIPGSPAEISTGRVGICVACHATPNFTDFRLHNTGTTQAEDELHGPGPFAALLIPNLTSRNSNYNQFLLPTESLLDLHFELKDQ